MTSLENQGRSRSRLVKIITVGIAICFLGTTLLLVIPNTGNPLTTQSCVGIVTKPSFQVGFAWANPLSSYLPPLMFSKYKVCVNLPMDWSTKRINGEFMLPP